MFPEYSCLKTHSWNGVILPIKVHFYSHFLLYKAFENCYSQTMAFCLMGGRLKHLNILFLMKEYERGVRARGEIIRKMSKDKVVAKNIKTGEFVKVSKAEFLENSDLVGSMKGRNLNDDNGARQMMARKKISKAKKNMVNVLLKDGTNIQIYKENYNPEIHKIHTGFSGRNNIIIITKDRVKHSVNSNDKILLTNDYIANNTKYIIEMQIDNGDIFTINNRNYADEICNLYNIKLPQVKRMSVDFTTSKCERFKFRKISSDNFF